MSNGSWEAALALRPCSRPMNPSCGARPLGQDHSEQFPLGSWSCPNGLADGLASRLAAARFMGSTVRGLRPVCGGSNFEAISRPRRAKTRFLQDVWIGQHARELLRSPLFLSDLLTGFRTPHSAFRTPHFVSAWPRDRHCAVHGESPHGSITAHWGHEPELWGKTIRARPFRTIFPWIMVLP